MADDQERSGEPNGGPAGDPNALAREDMGAATADGPPSEDSPRVHGGDTVAGSVINSGPNDPGFESAEEKGERARRTKEQDGGTEAPPEEPGRLAPGGSTR